MKKKATTHRYKNSPAPLPTIKPVLIGRGRYLTLTDYARLQGITRLTAKNLMRRGAIKTVQVGPRTVLVKLPKHFEKVDTIVLDKQPL